MLVKIKQILWHQSFSYYKGIIKKKKKKQNKKQKETNKNLGNPKAMWLQVCLQQHFILDQEYAIEASLLPIYYTLLYIAERFWYI